MNASTQVAAMSVPEVYQPIARLHANNYSRQSVCVDQAGPRSLTTITLPATAGRYRGEGRINNRYRLCG
jgi:hypothetical protein